MTSTTGVPCFCVLEVGTKETLLIRSSTHNIDKSRFSMKYNWQDSYRGAKVLIPGGTLVPHRDVVSMNCFVDTDHAGTFVTFVLKTVSCSLSIGRQCFGMWKTYGTSYVCLENQQLKTQQLFSARMKQ
jgi:hypothetical protein